MRLKPTPDASAKKIGARRGQMVLSTHAAANDDAVCPLGNDQLPGRLPTTSARTTSMNGRWRRNSALIGYSTAQVAPATTGSIFARARGLRGTRPSAATATPIDQ